MLDRVRPPFTDYRLFYYIVVAMLLTTFVTIYLRKYKTFSLQGIFLIVVIFGLVMFGLRKYFEYVHI
jgi:hypothetical protein